MKKSSYIDYLKTELGSHFWRATNRERNNYHSWVNNSSNPQAAINYQSTEIKDLIEFYLKELEFTPKEFVQALNDKRLIEYLYSSHYSYVSDRRTLQNIFEPLVRKDISFFSSALEECLSSHHQLYENMQFSGASERTKAEIDRNTEDFKNLLNIGLEENFFHKLPKELFVTKNSIYKRIMDEMKVVEQQPFEEQKLIDFIKNNAKSNNRNKSNLEEYCLFYIKDIVERFPTPGDFDAWAATHINNQYDKEGKPVEIINKISFFSTLTNDSNDESKLYQDALIDKWTDNMPFREALFSRYTGNFNFLKKHPHHIPAFLNKLNDAEILKLWGSGLNDLDFDRSYFDFKGVISKFPLENAPLALHGTIIEKLIDFRKSIHHSDDVMKDNASFSGIMHHLVDKSLKSLKNSNLDDETKKSIKIDLLNVMVKNNDILISVIHPIKDGINKNYHKIENNIKELRSYKKELGLSNQFFEDLDNLASHKIEMYFNSKKSEQTYYSSRNVNEAIVNTVNIISALQKYDVLDKLGLFDLKFDKGKPTGKKGRAAYLMDYPAIFEILEHTKDKSVINWIFQPQHIVDLKEKALYKNKNAIEYFSTFEKNSIIEGIFEELVNNKTVFKELVLDKKKTLKSVKEIENDFIQKSLTVMNLDKALPEKSEPLKPRTNKI